MRAIVPTLATVLLVACSSSPSAPPPPAAVASVAVMPAVTAIQVGATVSLSATPRDAGGAALAGRSVSWSSANPGVATVSGSGVVTAVTPGGPVTITATSEGVTGTATVTVTPVPVANVSVTPATATIQVGATTNLTATPRDAGGGALAGRSVSWSSGNPAIATVSGSGVVTAVSVGGPVTITATSEGISGTAAITVTAVPVANVSVTPATATIQVGATTNLTATPRDAGGGALAGRTVSWSSGNPAVATVSGSGVVTAVSVGGPVTITATSEGVTGSAAVTVIPVPVANVSVTPATATLQVGATTNLTATPRDAGGGALAGRTVSWSSGNPAIATVSGSGVVTAVSVGGPVTITATSEGISGTAAITVTAPPAASGPTLAVGSLSSCALTAAGAAWCWGLNNVGQLGNGTTTNALVATPVSGGHLFVELASSNAAYCGRTAAGAVWCWGENLNGTLGDGTNTNRSLPVAVSGGHLFTALSGSGKGGTICGLIAGGGSRCWGTNAGLLGNNSTTASNVPVEVLGPGSYIQVVSGSTVTCWLRTGGQAFCSTPNNNGEMGNGTTGVGTLVPTAAAGERRFVRLTAGANGVCGVELTGTNWCWGRGESGQLGNGGTAASSVSVLVTFPFPFAALEMGSSHSCGAVAAGTAYCWGAGSFLGTGDGVARLVPQQVAGSTLFTEIATTFTHSCGRSTTGAVFCWGAGNNGGLGNGSTAIQLTPTAVVGMP